MKKIRVFFDREGNTLDVWFEKPRKVICEETGEEVILKKDPRTKKVIGFEKLNFNQDKTKIQDLPVEVVVN
ncbi:MAG TPA: DUF2283 domain-containing protein [Candidatus Nanoarchaeia archaeon]|nr:DUF2283 domain-containing protein [Candidatus Nanoarchaeia archaeon]